MHTNDSIKSERWAISSMEMVAGFVLSAIVYTLISSL